LSMQRPDGDFTLWPEGQEVDRYAGAYAIWVLGLAREAGVAVPEAPLAKAHAALNAHLSAPLPTTPWGQRTALIERAFAAHALASAGEPPGETLALLFERLAELPPFARAILLMAVHAADPRDPRVATLRRQLSAALEARAGAAHVLVDEALGDAFYDSQVRTDAIALVALLQVAPDDPRIEPLARGLTRSRVGGRWRNTQENAWALLGLARYAAARERDAPDHRLTAWIGAAQVLDVERRAPAAPPEHARVAMPDLLRPLAPRGSDRTTHVVLDRDGPGRVYYRVGMEWATTGEAPARSQGLGLR
ncbi:MAG: hypothetical protein KC486_06015, partial [Myxococcales bacterium]|nr:hypothetical protein [Myxococcales bacterium]